MASALGPGPRHLIPEATKWPLTRTSSIILLMGIFFLASLWMLVFYQINYIYTRTFDEVSKETINLAAAFEEHVRRVISEADKDLLYLKTCYEREGILSPTFSFYWDSVVIDPSRSQVAIINEQGVVSKSLVKSALYRMIHSREYFLVHKSSDDSKLYVGKTISSVSSRQDVIPLTRRINKPDGSFGGVIYIALKADYFLSFYQKIDLGRNQLISITGLDGYSRTRRSDNDLKGGQDLRSAQIWKEVQAGKVSGTYMTENIIDGINRIMSFRVMPDYPLIVAVGKSTDVSMEEFSKIRQLYFNGAALISLFMVIAGMFLASFYAKQRDLNIELSRLDRLNLVGEMAASIGHEVRNPLTTVRGYLQLFLRKEKYSDNQEELSTMISELDRANSIITEFLSLAKNKSVKLKPGNINKVIDALFPLLQAEAFHSGCNLQMEQCEIPDVLFDENEIRQLILNLVRNGYEAMEPGRTLTIKTWCDSNEAVLSVCDSGKGIPQAILEKLGTPFLTTKASGTGLGLAVCYRIADRHGAKIEVNTSEKGTTFNVKFKLNKNVEGVYTV